MNHFFDHHAQLIEALSEELLRRAQECSKDPHALMALAGGSTPKPLYEAIAPKFDWSKIWLMPTDERCTPKTDSSSNILMINEKLGLRERTEKLIFLEKDPAQLIEKHNLFLHTILLGMGEDGHIASLFPPFLPKGDTEKFVQSRAPHPPFERISLSFEEIIKAKNIYLLFTGEKKRAVFERALLGVTADLPVSSLMGACGKKVEAYYT